MKFKERIKMKTVIFAIMLAQSALCAELLTPNHLFYTSEQSDKFAFESSDENDILQNPPPNKARIYGVRSKDYIGEKVDYVVFYQYEPIIEPNIKGQNEPIMEAKSYQGNIFGKFINASKFYKDFDANKLLILFSELETNSYLIFTPKAGKIYCVQGTIILGLHKARPNLNLIDKASCKRIYEELK